MKTIKELRDTGVISTRLYRALIRGITFDDKFKLVNKVFKWDVNRPNGNDLTVKDIFELWSEEEISKWRGLGSSCLEELKGLI